MNIFPDRFLPARGNAPPFRDIASGTEGLR